MSLTASRTPGQALYYIARFGIFKLVQELLNQDVKVVTTPTYQVIAASGKEVVQG
jgi:hypothetical protein